MNKKSIILRASCFQLSVLAHCIGLRL